MSISNQHSKFATYNFSFYPYSEVHSLFILHTNETMLSGGGIPRVMIHLANNGSTTKSTPLEVWDISAHWRTSCTE